MKIHTFNITLCSSQNFLSWMTSTICFGTWATDINGLMKGCPKDSVLYLPLSSIGFIQSSDLLMRRRVIFWSSASGAPRRPTFVARQTPSAADGSLGVKMLDGRVLGLSPHGLHSTVLLVGFLRTAIYVVYHSTDSASQQFLEHISTCNVYS